MTVKLNHLYLESYVNALTTKVCDQYFQQNKYMTGPEIVQLTTSDQVNLFVIKALFEVWQDELEKLKSSPFFDYRDKAVHDALKEFMNVLSRTIKIDRDNFEPLLVSALFDAFLVATDPLQFFYNEIEKCPEDQLNNYFKENKRYFKWHRALIENLIDRAALGYSHKAYKAAVANNYNQQANQLTPAEALLKSLSEILPIDFDQLIVEPKEEDPVEPKDLPQPTSEVVVEVKRSTMFTPIIETRKVESSTSAAEVKTTPIREEEGVVQKTATPILSGKLDPHRIWSRYESEEYTIMKGTIKELTESVGINQRFMFTKELFDGNPDLLRHALKSIDQCQDFTEAINLLNLRYVDELKWDLESDSLEEFLQLVFRKFDKRG